MFFLAVHRKLLWDFLGVLNGFMVFWGGSQCIGVQLLGYCYEVVRGF